ncbi:hypothetical protein ETAA8_35490 [Anatilimnocola aggregata]|uniref:Uncharacterized protein n=1 Tax=Anatilimnocola aggregata TaxID=2528021 RepID=A0A517YE03_9BACT|nr:hypothetical protein [Anatilimnocola aggregata]QDU28449.1 hypothetical protein ETAA8_35490 [Anatilimnocola aggregata]
MPDDLPLSTNADDFTLRPPDGPGREAIERFLDPPKLPEEPPAKPSEYQFRLTDILIVTAGVGLGLAGGSWMQRDIFAAILGLVTLIGLMLVHVYPPETRLGKLLWGTLVLAYLISVVAAIFRPVAEQLP